jgi:hypothetical protein
VGCMGLGDTLLKEINGFVELGEMGVQVLLKVGVEK